MRILRALCYVLRRAGGGLGRAPVSSASAVGIVAVVFLLFGLVHLAARNLADMTSAGAGAHMIVYLSDDVSPQKAHELGAALARLPAVKEQQYVSKGQAYETLRSSLGQQGDALAGIEVGMLPASIELTLSPGVRDVAAIHPLVERLEAMAGVASVEVAGAWVERLSALFSGLRRAVWFLFLLVGAACMYVVATAVGLRLRTSRTEAKILDLFGASTVLVRGPLVIQGAIQGGLGAGLAAIALWISFAALSPKVAQTLQQAFGDVATPSFLPPAHIALLIAAGLALGLVGGLLATRNHEMA